MKKPHKVVFFREMGYAFTIRSIVRSESLADSCGPPLPPRDITSVMLPKPRGGMVMKFETPLLDQLETGPWPSVVSDIKQELRKNGAFKLIYTTSRRAK